MGATRSLQPPDSMRRVAPKLAELTTGVLFGDIWERSDLSQRDRSLITCAMLAAMYRPDQLRFHLKLALANGVTKTEIGEMITHVAFYAGWPSGAQASQIADEVLNATG